MTGHPACRTTWSETLPRKSRPTARARGCPPRSGPRARRRRPPRSIRRRRHPRSCRPRWRPPRRARWATRSTARTRADRTPGEPEHAETTINRLPSRAASSIACSSAAWDAREASVASRIVSIRDIGLRGLLRIAGMTFATARVPRCEGRRHAPGGRGGRPGRVAVPHAIHGAACYLSGGSLPMGHLSHSGGSEGQNICACVHGAVGVVGLVSPATGGVAGSSAQPGFVPTTVLAVVHAAVGVTCLRLLPSRL